MTGLGMLKRRGGSIVAAAAVATIGCGCVSYYKYFHYNNNKDATDNILKTNILKRNNGTQTNSISTPVNETSTLNEEEIKIKKTLIKEKEEENDDKIENNSRGNTDLIHKFEIDWLKEIIELSDNSNDSLSIPTLIHRLLQHQGKTDKISVESVIVLLNNVHGVKQRQLQQQLQSLSSEIETRIRSELELEKNGRLARLELLHAKLNYLSHLLNEKLSMQGSRQRRSQAICLIDEMLAKMRRSNNEENGSNGNCNQIISIHKEFSRLRQMLLDDNFIDVEKRRAYFESILDSFPLSSCVFSGFASEPCLKKAFKSVIGSDGSGSAPRNVPDGNSGLWNVTLCRIAESLKFKDAETEKLLDWFYYNEMNVDSLMQTLYQASPFQRTLLRPITRLAVNRLELIQALEALKLGLYE